MEDEIDIEEHDVLDNPKIRDIFPDLSLVKVEVPDEDVTDQYNDFHELIPELQYSSNIKQEVPSDNEQEYEQINELCYEQSEQSGQSVLHYQSFSDTIGYHIEQNEQSEQIGEIVQNKQIELEVPFNNKIILGSKPIDYDLLYQEALKSDVQIHLEDWDMRLKSSPCYCNSCETLFPTVNALDAHNSSTHSFLIALDKTNTARKSTVTTSRFCNHCNRTFPNDTALITHLYELLPLNNFQEPAPSYQKPNNYQHSPVEETYEYKCIKCNKYFASFVDGKRHKKLKHPSLTNVNIIVKIVNKNDNIKLKNLPKGKNYYISNLIPKSMLFQCNICQINFISCYTALQHSHTCENRIEFHKCNICKRKIRKRDSDIHAMQHKYTEKLKIYTIHKTMYEKVLLKCPKCSICYDEQAFRIHEKSCDGSQSNFVRCKICSIDISTSRYDYHKSKHESKKYIRKDFIIVEFYDLNSSTQKVEKNDKVDKLQAKNTILYYCDTCGSYKNILSPNGHTADMCKTLNVLFCEICGLGFAKHTFYVHKMLHTKHNLTLKDFKIFSLKTGEAIDTPMSNFHECQYCGIHFLTKKGVLIHNCDKEKFNTCEICNKKFNTKAYSPHCNFHNLDNLPELLEKYNSINNMWNVKYLCVACNMVTMTYDSVVEHSQNHINEIHTFNTKFCTKCGFKILNEHFKMHMNLHENNILLDRDQFMILEYDYKELFTSKWMNMLSPLPKQHKYQILIKSIYRFSRRFKLNCKINCETDDYKLFCMKCKTSVNMQQMKNHYFANACRYSSKYTCGICMLHFKRLHDCVSHESEHDTIAKKYKVITYNDEKDVTFDQKLKNFELASSNESASVKSIPTSTSVKPAKFKTKSRVKSIKSKLKKAKVKVKASKARISATLEGIIEKYNRFKLYKCEKCNSCISLKQNVVKHNCIFETSRKRLCVICKQYFYARNLHMHMKLHKKYPRINKTIVIPFNCDKNTATIYQCECKLNFTSKPTIEKHINICNDNLSISKEKCSKCNLLFPTEVLVSHLCKHHSKPVNIKIKKFKRSAQNAYKCAKCKVVYPNLSHFEDHLFNCPVKTIKRCDKCRLLIDQKSFSDHKCNQEISIVKNNAVPATVYRCSSCNLTYLLKKSLSYHLEVKHVSHRDIGTCDICNLRFTTQTLNKHNLIHDKYYNYIIKVIDTDSNNYSIIKGSNYSLGCIQKTKNSALINKKKSIKNSNQKISVDQKISPKKVDQKISDDDIVNESLNTTVFKCGACNICYLLRKRWYYHSINNHILKHRREIIPCCICGLRFPDIFLEKHMTAHAVGENYTIEVIEPDTNKITVITGKNTKSTNTKRKLNSDNSITKNKKAKMNDILIDQSLPVKRVKKDDTFTDLPSTSKTISSLRSRQIKKEVAEKPNPKMDFESINMSEDDTILSDDEITTDPLNNTAGSDDNFADNISKKLKSKLNSCLGIYNNTLYRSKCNLNFMAKRSANNHTMRDCRGKCLAYKCNLCPYEFTKKSLTRHQYVHHTKMNLKAEHIHIELFCEDEFQKKTKIDRSRKVEIVAENVKNNYYKCKDCNVCFIDENNCKRHCISHIPLDSKSYIECKICNFQFLIESLQKHVNVHHSTEFCLEDLMITEYSVTGDRHPKIEVYRGIDKVQSRLVSTTTDMVAENSETDIFGL